ncbi:MAG: hypothetical protein NZM00_12805, partial [Anaerolinea sp.]|nr:hypothetical protein [Anaerolinea sp.]
MGNEKISLEVLPIAAEQHGRLPSGAASSTIVHTHRKHVEIDYRLFDDLPVVAFVPHGNQGDRFRALLERIADQPSFEPFQHPAVLIAPSVETAVSRLHESMQQYQKTDWRPLVAIVTRHPTPAQAEQADVLLPWSDVWCRYHLRQALKNRTPHPAAQSAPNTVHNELELVKTAIVHNISHELRTPLLQIKSAVSQIIRALPDDPYLNQLSDYASQAVGRLEGLVSRVIRIARGIEIQLEPTLPSDVLNLALRQLRTSWEHRTNI